MEELHNLSSIFKKLLKQLEKEMFDYIDSKELDCSDELLELKAILGMNTMVRLEHCYLSIIYKATEQIHTSIDANVKQSAQLLYHYRNFCNKAVKNGEELYGRISKKLLGTLNPYTDIIVPVQPFAFNVRLIGEHP